MKHSLSTAILALVLALTLIIGAVALAESTEPATPEQTPVEDTQPAEDAPAEEAPATEAPATEAPATQTQDNTALQEALDAYRSAKESSRVESIESELNEYVASGKLTQEQADLILNYYKEQAALRNGTCPNCGYEFQNGGRTSGGKGGRGNKGMRGGFGGKQQQNTAPNAGSASGTSYEDQWSVMPNVSNLEGI